MCRGRQQFHFHPFSPKKQASDWLAPQEANVNNNNSLEAPIRGLLFGGKLEERNCHHPAPHQTSNHTQLVQRKSRMVLYSKASSAPTHLGLRRFPFVSGVAPVRVLLPAHLLRLWPLPGVAQRVIRHGGQPPGDRLDQELLCQPQVTMK